MLELGAVFFSQHGQTTLLVQRSDGAGLPADLQGHLAGQYDASADLDEIAKQIGQVFAKHARLTPLLDNPQRERYLAPEKLAELCRNLLRALQACHTNHAEKDSYHALWQLTLARLEAIAASCQANPVSQPGQTC